MKFTELDLIEELQTNLQSIGFTECTGVQEQVIPALLEGKDVSALSQTGTGKTAAFMLPMMNRVMRGQRGWAEAEGLTDEEREDRSRRVFKDWKKGQFILVLVPTRELAEQVYQDFYKLRGTTGLEAATIYGGTEYEEQRRKLQANVEFVIGTPGRLIDLYKSHVLDLRQVRATIFDEADRMFDMGFKDDMKFLLQRVPKDRQILLFSATMNFDVLHTAYQFGSEPVEFNLSKDQVKAENVEDQIFHLGQKDKPKYVLSILKKYNPTQVIIFSNFKHNVERIANFLTKNDVPAMGISSLLTQAQRNRVISMFKEASSRSILVATDVAARGLDIKNVDLIINYDLPDDCENYVHRIGRTGRAGATGKAFSLVSDRDVEALTRIEEYLKHKLEQGWMEDSELATGFKEMTFDNDRHDRPAWEDRPPRRDSGGGRPERRPRPAGDRGPRNDGARADGPRNDRGPQGPRGPRSGPDSRGPDSRGPDSRGPRNDRGPRTDNRNDRGPRDQRPRPAAGADPGAAAPAGAVHRDRVSGRHGQRPSGPAQANGRSGSHAKPQHRTGSGANKTASHAQGANKTRRTHEPLKRRPLKSQKDKGLIGKVSGFLKGLFK